MCAGSRVTTSVERLVTSHFQERDKLDQFAGHRLLILVGDRIWSEVTRCEMIANDPTHRTVQFVGVVRPEQAAHLKGAPVKGMALLDDEGHLVARNFEFQGNYTGGQWTCHYRITIHFPAGRDTPAAKGLRTFKKKPVEVRAVQWEGPWHKLPGIVFEESVSGDAGTAGGERVRFYVVTIHGQNAYIVPGDWLIEEPDQAHFYPCKDDVFDKSYDPI
jgi:hypothetical protein